MFQRTQSEPSSGAWSESEVSLSPTARITSCSQCCLCFRCGTRLAFNAPAERCFLGHLFAASVRLAPSAEEACGGLCSWNLQGPSSYDLQSRALAAFEQHCSNHPTITRHGTSPPFSERTQYNWMDLQEMVETTPLICSRPPRAHDPVSHPARS